MLVSILAMALALAHFYFSLHRNICYVRLISCVFFFLVFRFRFSLKLCAQYIFWLLSLFSLLYVLIIRIFCFRHHQHCRKQYVKHVFPFFDDRSVLLSFSQFKFDVFFFVFALYSECICCFCVKNNISDSGCCVFVHFFSLFFDFFQLNCLFRNATERKRNSHCM